MATRTRAAGERAASTEVSEGEDQPAVGAPIVLQPAGSGGSRPGTVHSWTAGPSGIVVTSRVEVDPDVVPDLAGVRVWASVRTQRTATLVVIGGVAQETGRPGQIALTGVTSVAREHRRAAVRAHARRAAHLRLPDESVIATHTVDLSRMGARIALPHGQHLETDVDVTMSMELEQGETVTVSATVLRSDDEAGHAIVRFTELGQGDRDLIEDDVLAYVQSLRSR